MKKFLLILIIFSSFLSLFLSCDDSTGPPNNNAKINLTLEDVSCTEVWLKLEANNPSLKNEIILYREEEEIKRINLINNDTIIFDEDLLPNKTYTYQAIKVVSNEEVISSEKVSVTTMDTTSHNFTWETFTFGEHSSSVLYDVAIINENNIWAVGEIYMNDSTGKPDPLPYNAVHWYEGKWTVMRITVDFRGNQITPPIYGIYAFTPNDIWLSSGVPVHGDGTNWTQYHLFDMGVLGPNDGYLTKIWGSSSDNLFYVGTKGTIAHYLNGQWQKIESGTTTNINDIWGINNTAGSSLILATVSSRYQRGDYKLLSVSGNTAKEYFSWPYTRLYGVWFNSPRNIYIVGDGAYEDKNNNLKAINLPTNNFLTRVKGNTLNDIYISTSGALIFHYNGINWQKMSDGINGNYEGLDVKGNTVALTGFNVVGGRVGNAVITIGKH